MMTNGSHTSGGEYSIHHRACERTRCRRLPRTSRSAAAERKITCAARSTAMRIARSSTISFSRSIGPTVPRKRSTPRRSILVLALVASITLVGGPANAPAGAAVRPAEVGTSDGRAQVSYHRFVEPDGPITIGSGTVATWTSSDFAPGFAFTELVASWNAD